MATEPEMELEMERQLTMVVVKRMTGWTSGSPCPVEGAHFRWHPLNFEEACPLVRMPAVKGWQGGLG